MLVIKNIKKNYGDVQALKGIDLSFRDNEFVSILGPSGCGKTTFLNIVGGLDRYSSGDLLIKGKSTKEYKDKQWDAYRNQSIGFVFQSYNLIPHLTVLQNVELSMKLSGISNKEARSRAEAVLIKVGLHDQFNKKPNQMSGGQMQRVAIARALVNDPEIILADEPTGALDSKTSLVVMELLKEIAQTKLVIMVTHNADLAHEYSSRVIEFKDGEVMSDSKPMEAEEVTATESNGKLTAMSYFTALSLSGRNLWAKKGRTLLTSFAGSIGIIGIALVLALSSGLSGSIATLQQDTLASSPITIDKQSFNFNNIQAGVQNSGDPFPENGVVNIITSEAGPQQITNNITQEYIDYVEKIDPELVISVQTTNGTVMNLLQEVNGEVIATNSTNLGMKALMRNTDFISRQYDVLSGSIPSGSDDLLLVVDKYNALSKDLGEALGISGEIKLESLVGKEFTLVSHNDFYKENSAGLFSQVQKDSYAELATSPNSRKIKITGIARVKEDAKFELLTSGLYYTEDLAEINNSQAVESDVVASQKEVGSEYNVTTGQPFVTSPFSTAEQMYEDTLATLGADSLPTSISIVPLDFDSKTEIRTYLDAYNEGKEDEAKIIYADLSEITTELMGTLVNTISYVLIAFSSISLIVSSVMIGIITYVSVIERTKEIGVLRSLGARKKDISRVFNAETFLIGLVAGALGVGVTYLLQFPINAIVYDLTNTANIADLKLVQAISLISISILLTFIAGLLPSRMAAKKDPVVALRSE